MSDANKNVLGLVGKAADETARKSPDEADAKTKEAVEDHNRKAKSASLRAQDAEEATKQVLRERINVIQDKLNKREEELHACRPRVAELEHAERTTKVASFLEGIVIACGGAMLGLASFMGNTWASDWIEWKPYLIGGGIAATATGTLAKVLFGFFGWPKKRKT